MNERTDIGQLTCRLLADGYRLMKEDIGADAHLEKDGFAYDLECYTAEGFGHLCVMRMDAMGGLMKMETAVLACTSKDVPLFNLDWVGAMGKETQMAELYDVQLSPYPEEKLAAFAAIKAGSADLPDRETAPHWYDGILYPCSYDKTGEGYTARFSADAKRYLEEFLRQVKAAPDADTEARKAKIREFAETLFAQGGPAVDQVTRLFGKETARRIIVGHMYGAGQ